MAGSDPKQKGKDIESGIDNFHYVYQTDNQQLTGDISRKVQPYLRALFVDRRFDFDVVIMAPSINNNFSMYTNKDRDVVWKGGRISGWTYNGIEMSYDEDYNVISAHTRPANYTSPDEDVEYSAATFNKRLEYTYKYDCAHKCLTCGYEGKDMFREIPVVDENNEQVFDEDGNPIMKIVEECPKCHLNTVQLFHGEIGTSEIVRRRGNINYYELKKHTEDNVTIIFFAFQNFYERMKEEEFEYKYNGNICKYIGGEIDLGLYN
jgi:hypothetical protein